MKTIFQRHLSFVSSGRSDTWIARETGIPRSTLGFIRRGERPAPAGYESLIRNVYQREGYRRMRETGFSRAQARRFQWHAAESVALKESEMKLLVDKFTTGATGAKIAALRREGISYDQDEIWAEMKAKIIEALQHSKEPVEEFADPDY